MNTAPAASARSTVRALVAAFVVTAGSTLAATAASAAPVAPPHHTDAVHVYNGCHLSALGYLARFQAEYPRETGCTVVIRMDNADGHRHPHTMALVSWQGTWWCRDEYFGVFSLDCPTSSQPSLDHIETRYLRHARECLRDPAFTRPTAVPAFLSATERASVVRRAAAVIPYAHTVYWVRHGRDEVPVVFFRPAPGQVAVYDPASGTGVASCASLDDAQVVTAVARQLGYGTDRLHADAGSVRPAYVTAANTSFGGAAQ